MQTLAGILGGLCGAYTVLIMIRVIITWFSRGYYGKPYEILCRVTDPYLNLFRRIPALKSSGLDLSPIAAMAVLSLGQNIFGVLSTYGRISLGLILALIVSALWSAAAFVLGFFIAVLLLHLAGLIFRWGGIFREVIDAIARPLLYRTGRLLFRKRLVDYRQGIFASLATLALAYILGGLVVKSLLIPLLAKLPF
jgi:YggT family protein